MGSLPHITAAHIRVPSSFHGTLRPCTLHRWILLSCDLLPWAVYRRLSGTGAAILHRPRLVPSVSALRRPRVTRVHCPTRCLFHRRCTARPEDLDTGQCPRRSHELTAARIDTSASLKKLWDEHGIVAELTVCIITLPTVYIGG